MKKQDFYDLAAELEQGCGDWKNKEGLSAEARRELLAKVEAMDKEKSGKIKHISAKTFYLPLLVAVLVLLLGIGAMGNRVWISDGNRIERASEVTTKVNNEKKESILLEEEEIYQEISEELGIAPVWLGYRPDGMKLDSYTIIKDTGWAYVNYLFENKVITVQMTKGQGEVSGNVQWIGDYRILEDVENIYDIEIDACCTDEEHKLYSAKFNYDYGCYGISGCFQEEEEFLKILERIYF